MQLSNFIPKMLTSFRFRSATPQAQAAMLRSVADQVAAPSVSPGSFTASAAPVASTPRPRSGPPAKVTRPAASVAPRKPVDVAKLSRELDALAAMADTALAHARAERQRRELSGLKGLSLTAAATRQQLTESGFIASTKAPGSMPAPDGVGQESAAVRRSKPDQWPAYVPPVPQEIRLKQCNDYYSEALSQARAELERARLAGFIPNSIPARIRRLDREWTEAANKIRGFDVRDRK